MMPMHLLSTSIHTGLALMTPELPRHALFCLQPLLVIKQQIRSEGRSSG